MQDLKFYFIKMQQNKTAKSFKKIYFLSSRQLYGVILRILKNKEISEDCLQEVYIKIYNNIGRYDESKSQPLTWMITITRNYVIDYLRKKQLHIADNFDMNVIDDEQIKILQNLENSETHKFLRQCLLQLDVKIRNIIFMVYFQGKTYQQISQILQIPVSTLKTSVVRSLPKLKKCLKGVL